MAAPSKTGWGRRDASAHSKSRSSQAAAWPSSQSGRTGVYVGAAAGARVRGSGGVRRIADGLLHRCGEILVERPHDD